MPVDYDRIHDENLIEYGRGDRHLAFLGRLYSDRTHFIFELVQNAEDAGATELTFDLRRDRLEVHHNGRAFTEADVRGICGIAESTKTDDLTAIGKFGIGFKSVYAYTSRPEVHDGEEHFCIERYVRPVEIRPRQTASQHTLFVFPFDRDDVSAAVAVKEISDALNNLDLTTMLFMRSIDRILLTGDDVVDAVLAREISPRSEHSDHITLTETADDDERSDWRVWSREVPGHAALRVQIAFSVAGDSGRVRALAESPLVVFFPTEKESYLGFLAQGPYRTTPARDNIPHDDEWNHRLVVETASLVKAALRDLRDEGLLGVDALLAMPIEPGRFPPDGMLRPIFDAVVAALREEALIPTADGGHAPATEVRIARGRDLRDLLGPSQFGLLFGSQRPLRWVAPEVSADRTRGLWQYMREVLRVEEITPESVIGRLTSQFLERQPDEWLVRLYAFIHQNRALWRRPTGRAGVLPVALTRAIVRLEDGSHTKPFDQDLKPLAYLPGMTTTEFPTVRASIVEVAPASDFLRDLGLVEPDVIAEVLERVLPRYADHGGIGVDAPTHTADLDRIAQALADDRRDRSRHLQARLRASPFLQGRNVASGEIRWCRPTALYASSPANLTYLDGNPDVHVLRDGYDRWLPQLITAGLRAAPEVTARTPGRSGYVDLVDLHGRHERGVDGFDPDAAIEHLEFALANPSASRSALVWNDLLRPNRHLVAGVVETSGRQNFVDPTSVERRSVLGELAATRSWLPAPDGTWVRPEELTLDDLPPEYARDHSLAQALGMSTIDIEELGRQAGIPAEVLMDLRDPDTQAEWEEFRRSREAVGDDLTDGDARDETESGPEVDFAAALADAFDRRASTSRDDQNNEGGLRGGSVSNPQLRRTRIREAIADDKSGEPRVRDRFQPVPHRVWEAKNSATRHFVEEQYRGRCQVCGDTFSKRDGRPYFEAVYLVSRTTARWIDRPGNVLCLCATCSAKVRHGPVVADTLIHQVRQWRTAAEGGSEPALSLHVCGESVQLRFTEKHLLDLQEMLASGD